MRYLVGFVWVCLLGVGPLVGCGEDMVELCAVEVDSWLKDNPPPLDNDNMVDTYTLHHFVINLYIDEENVGWIDSDEFESFSGTLDIQENTIAATVTVEGETETSTGYYKRTIESPYNGVLRVDDGSETYDLNYSFLEWCDDAGSRRLLN